MTPCAHKGLILAASFARLPARSLAVTEGWSLNWASAASPQQFARVLLPWVYSPEFFEDPQNFELAVAAIGQAPIQPAAQHDLLAQGIPSARLQMPDCAHSCMFERATQFNQAVLDFLADPN
ncbi:hypothetical protein IV102_30070 [bacterium]|nr:hypothetical protein [bacterium]